MLRVDIQAKDKCKDHASREHSTRRVDCVWCRRIASVYQRAAQLDAELRAAERLGAELRWHGRAEFAPRTAGRAYAIETANTPLRLEVRICVAAACPHHPSQQWWVYHRVPRTSASSTVPIAAPGAVAPPPACAICRQLECALRRAIELKGELCVFEFLKVMVQLRNYTARTVSTVKGRNEIN